MPFEPRELRDVFGTFVTGVTIITTATADGQHWGVTANSFTSVSLEPPLVLWSQAKLAYSHSIFQHTERFVVNILARDQIELSRRFSAKHHDRFADVEIRRGLGGLPVLTGCVAFLECRKVDSYPGGDHTLFLGEVENFERADRQPLAFCGGRYGTPLPLE